jgi:hypothetical protein
LGLFCRKTGVGAKKNSTLFCVFTTFWDYCVLQGVAAQGEAAAGTLQKKSCLKTYRRFFGFLASCLNHQRNEEHEAQRWKGGARPRRGPEHH